MTINEHLVAKLRLNRIKLVLVEKERSGKDLARHLGKTETTVSRWSKNEVQPTLETLYEISVYLKVDIRELLVSTKE
ncbi:helix-turn-helix transcriptional regulator [Dyadobacter sp. OTU695]|uniref:helix-turn-helix transcriptional regulator n=1 Tax=Dyadobacter sp. OTU695 TaxID=3043860 RepID=UPI00313A7FBB